MNLQKIADQSLKSMVNDYHQSGRETFGNDYFVELFPNEHPKHINNALQILKDDGLIKLFFADDIPYLIALIPSGIRAHEENTWIKKGYQCIKEIRQLLPPNHLL